MVKVFAPPAQNGTGLGANTNQAGVTDETLKSRNEPRQQMMKAKKAECAHAIAALGVGGVGRRAAPQIKPAEPPKSTKKANPNPTTPEARRAKQRHQSRHALNPKQQHISSAIKSEKSRH